MMEDAEKDGAPSHSRCREDPGEAHLILLDLSNDADLIGTLDCFYQLRLFPRPVLKCERLQWVSTAWVKLPDADGRYY